MAAIAYTAGFALALTALGMVALGCSASTILVATVLVPMTAFALLS